MSIVYGVKIVYRNILFEYKIICLFYKWIEDKVFGMVLKELLGILFY